MKNIWLKSALMAVTIFSTVSCADFLNLTPEDLIVEDNYWDEKNDVDQVLIGCYTRMQDQDFLSRAFVWGEARADNVAVGNCKAGDAEYEIMQENILSTNTYTSWTPFYAVINRCNLVIDRAPKVAAIDPDYSESDMRATIAEATGLRALCYFYLVRTFKDVPYYTYAITSDDQDLTLPVTDGDRIVAELIHDLETIEGDAALKYLNGSVDVTCARMSRVAIWALLADMNLWTGNYAQAIEYADKVIDYKNRSNPYSDVYDMSASSSSSSMSSVNRYLRVSYFAGVESDENGGSRAKYTYYPLWDDAMGGGRMGQAFTEIFGSKLSAESIFELSFDSSSDADNTKGNLMIDDFFYRYVKRGSLNPAVGKFTAAQAFIQQYNSDNASGAFLGWNVTPGSDAALSTPDARFLEAIHFGNSQKGDASSGILMKFNGTDYYAYPRGTATTTVSYTSYFWRDGQKNNANWIFYRTSDMMLIKAEALVNAYPNDENSLRAAFALVQAVNDRSNVERTLSPTNYDKLKFEEYGFASALYQLIMDERRREFLFEGKRWFDLVRQSRIEGNTNKLKQACVSKMTQGATSGSGKLTNMNAIYFPYNKTELQTNPNLKQNPAYPEVDSDSYESTK